MLQKRCSTSLRNCYIFNFTIMFEYIKLNEIIVTSIKIFNTNYHELSINSLCFRIM